MEQLITQELQRVFERNNLVLQDFVLRNIRFSESMRRRWSRSRLPNSRRSRRVLWWSRRSRRPSRRARLLRARADAAVIAAKGQAEARIIQAQAEAEALRLIAKALEENPNLLTYQYITKDCSGDSGDAAAER